MNDSRSNALVAAERLRLTLEGVADAIRGARIEDLLGAEDQLVMALADVARIRTVDPADRATLRAELGSARTALQTCRQLGAIVRQATDACLVAQGRGGAYTRAGSSSALEMRGTGVHVRI